MSGTTLQYGTYALENCLTEQYSQEVRYDPTGTDVWFHEHTITVSTVVFGSNFGASIGATLTPGSTAAEVERALGVYLLHPRRPFRMTINGSVILEAATLDADNGPHPVSLEVSRVAPAAFNIRFTIRVAVVQCPSEGIDPISGAPIIDAAAIPNVVSHKWNYEETIDDRWYRRRTWNGTIRVRDISTPPDVFRRLVVPPLSAGFRVESMRFSMEPNGLNGAYTIVHAACDAAAPYPALKWGGTHSRRLGIDGIKQEAFYHVFMEGAPGCNKVQLLARCFQAARGRIGTLGLDEKGAIVDSGTGAQVQIRSVEIMHAENDSRVELRMAALVMPDPQGDPTALGMKFERFGQEFSQFPGYDREASTPLDPVDPRLPLGAFVSYLQSPCGGPKAMPQIAGAGSLPPEGTNPPQEQPQGEERPQPEPSAQYNIVPVVPQDPAPLKTSQVQQTREFYQAYDIFTQFRNAIGKVAIPLFTALEDGTEIVTVQRRPAMTTRVVEIHAERTNALPQLPSIEDVVGSEQTAVLLSSNISPEAPRLEPDGRSLLYVVKARFEYAMKKALTPSTDMQIGRSPYMAEEGVTTKFKLSDYTDNSIVEGQ